MFGRSCLDIVFWTGGFLHLAGCAMLQGVHITISDDQQPRRAVAGSLAALAAGAAAGSLQQIEVDSLGCVFGVPQVAALLCGNMPQPQRLKVCIMVPEGTIRLLSQDAVLEALPELLVQHGACHSACAVRHLP
jgi:hypothetical protein